MTADRGGPVGNTYDKYGTKNPFARLLVARFRARVDTLVARVAPESLLDVGCGEGIVTQALAAALRGARVVGLDVADEGLQAEWRRRVGAEFVAGSAYALPFPDEAFDLVTALEVLEHLERPADALAELARVSRGLLLVSVPREPLWRALNLSTGRYIRALGNTPGHIQHFSRGAVTRLVSGAAHVEEVSGPLPWTIVLASVRSSAANPVRAGD